MKVNFSRRAFGGGPEVYITTARHHLRLRWGQVALWRKSPALVVEVNAPIPDQATVVNDYREIINWFNPLVWKTVNGYRYLRGQPIEPVA